MGVVIMVLMKTDIKAIKKLNKQIKKISREDKKKLCKDIATETASVLLRRVKQKTPVDTGNLRRNWSFKGQLLNRGYEVTVFNQTEYAPYVEYGHRLKTRNGYKWTKGHYMLTKSQKETLDLYTKIVSKNVNNYLGDLLK